jgi:hypothetical protein
MPRLDATAAFVAAAQAAYVKPIILVQVNFTTGPVYIWSGIGSKSWNGNTYAGVGQFGMISSVEEGSDVHARGIVLSLSGIDPTLLGDVLNDYQQGLPVLVHLGLLDPSTGNIISNPICSFSGRTDQPTIDVSGESAKISIACENRLVEMNTSVERRYTNEDQQIDHPGDLGFAFVNAIQNVTVYWGRLPTSHNNYNFSQGS